MNLGDYAGSVARNAGFGRIVRAKVRDGDHTAKWITFEWQAILDTTGSEHAEDLEDELQR